MVRDNSRQRLLMKTNLAVLGSPITHSKSPNIHQAAHRVLGLDWEYTRFQCESDQLEQFLQSHTHGWRGFSLTMPLKEEAYRLAESVDSVARQSGVVNTLVGTETGWSGFNTDVPGLRMALEHNNFNLQDTVILGAGATAVSAVLAAKLAGATRVTVLARRPEAAEQLASRLICAHDVLGSSKAAQPTTVISTLPGQVGATVPVHEGQLQSRLFDVAYDPWPSPLSKRWNDAGGQTTSGIEMLIFQALIQIRIFVHADPALPLPNEAAVLAAMRQATTG